jgi:transcriptional regulator with XRE-family HTH domain
MAVSPADARATVERVCTRPDVLGALARRDLGMVITALGGSGMTQGRIAELTGIPQGRLSEWKTGKRGPQGVSTFEKFANGLGLPPAARRALGLDGAVPQQASAVPLARIDVSYPGTPAEAAVNLSNLWLTDLGDPAAVRRGRPDPRIWNDAPLRWLVDPGPTSAEPPARGVGIGLSDVERFRVTVDVFTELDDRFGGGNARQALVQYLSTEADRMLNGKFDDATGRKLFSAVGEATLLAAWMSYDSAPAGALAQGYFVNALALARAGNDRMLGATILDAMSHQATYTGRYTEAASLARAALTGTNGIVTPTQTAHFRMMEARALARLRDTKSCSHALAEAAREFERRNPEDDPLWIRYVNESELAAEFAHCMRDLGRAEDAIRHATNSLEANGGLARSDFFVTLVLADAHLAVGNVEEACGITLHALNAGEQIRSARCVGYLREFMNHLPASGKGTLTDFREQARESRLWRIASQPERPAGS